MTTQPNDVIEILAVFAEIDDFESIFWNTKGEHSPITLFVLCNDTFCWGSADAEEITIDNLSILKDAIRDVKEVDSVYGTIWAPTLFCCRVRGMRPQGPAYPKSKGRALWHLFDACGPERPDAGKKPIEEKP
jgi:hypothetical protein